MRAAHLHPRSIGPGASAPGPAAFLSVALDPGWRLPYLRCGTRLPTAREIAEHHGYVGTVAECRFMAATYDLNAVVMVRRQYSDGIEYIRDEGSI